ncbi:MAG: hypothetical protein ACK4RW_12835 [Rehaibacterium terrae]|uniref:hypothetical protein n=1 Tax=Rehaibacterium terrae TaxID=1341696 RepID=UPI00391CD8D0
MRLRQLAIRALPWLLLAGMTGFAAIGWVHFIAKDQALWQRSFETVHTATALIDRLDAHDTRAVRDALLRQREEQCDWIARYAEHVPHDLAEALRQTRVVCDTPVPPWPADHDAAPEDSEDIEQAAPDATGEEDEAGEEAPETTDSGEHTDHPRAS